MFVTNLHGKNKFYSKLFEVMQILSDINVVVKGDNGPIEIQLDTYEKATGWALCEPLFVHEGGNQEWEIETIIGIDYTTDGQVLAITTSDNYYNKDYLSDEDEWDIDYNILSNTKLSKYPKCPIKINDKVRILKTCTDVFGNFITRGSIVTVDDVEMIDMDEYTTYGIRVKQLATNPIIKIRYEAEIFEMICAYDADSKPKFKEGDEVTLDVENLISAGYAEQGFDDGVFVIDKVLSKNSEDGSIRYALRDRDGDMRYIEECFVYSKYPNREIQKDKELEITGEPLEKIKLVEDLIKMEKESLEMDKIINPDYYKQGKYETIDVIESIVNQNLSGFEGYLVGNIIKYVSRFKMKNGVKDLKKAKWYLEQLISENE